MIHRTNEDREKRPLIYRIDADHLAMGLSSSWMGVNVYAIKDLDLLIEWWNKNIRYSGDPMTKEIKDKRMSDLQSAIWIRINELHPKHLLKFEDITRPELLKKVA
jgi:hypothetical protein